MALFNVQTSYLMDGRPKGFLVEAPYNSLDDLHAALIRDRAIRCDRVFVRNDRGMSDRQHDRDPLILGLGIIGQISLATRFGSGATAKQVSEIRKVTTQPSHATLGRR